MHATHRLYSQSEFEPPGDTPDDNGGGTENVEFEPGSKDGDDESETSGIDDGSKNVGVANEETGAGGTIKKGEETGAGGANPGRPRGEGVKRERKCTIVHSR